MTATAWQGITVENLSTWQMPTLEETESYWAFLPNRLDQQAFQLPHEYVYGVLPGGSLKVYVDAEEGWLWAAVSDFEYEWTPRGERRWEAYRGEPSPVPAWVREAPRNYPRHSDDSRLDARRPRLVRRRLAESEAAVLLDQIMPPVAKYPVAAPLAEIVRLGGWTPQQIDYLWWALEDERDAAVLAAHPLYWWEKHGWLFTTRTHHKPDFGPPARVLGELVARGVRPDVTEVCLRAGITDVEEIAALRPHQVPDDATRIYYLPQPYGSAFALDAERARADLDLYPDYWLRRQVADTGVTPLHISDMWAGDSRHFVLWSDGMLAEGYVRRPLEHEGDRDWHRQYREFEQTQHLLLRCLDAANREELSPELWMPWRGAVEVTGEVTEETSRSRGVDTDLTVERVLRRTRHTIRLADGSTSVLWQHDVDLVTVHATHRSTGNRELVSRTTTLHTDTPTAEQAWQDLHDDLPVVATVEEIAELAGRTREALAQAFSRATRAHNEQCAKAANDPRREYPRPTFPYRVLGAGRGDTSWYDPREVLAFLAARPGHGPGRPRRT